MEEEDFPNFSLEFNFPSIQETAEKPNEQQQQARRFPALQEEALSLVIFNYKRNVKWFPCLHNLM